MCLLSPPWHNTMLLLTLTDVMYNFQSISESKICYDILIPKPQAMRGVALNRIFVLC